MQIDSYAGFTIFCNECVRCQNINSCGSKSTVQATSLIEIFRTNDKFSYTATHIATGHLNLELVGIELRELWTMQSINSMKINLHSLILDQIHLIFVQLLKLFSIIRQFFSTTFFFVQLNL